MTPTTTIEVKGSRTSVQIVGVIDTGFDGELCLPVSRAVPLGLELDGREILRLADGSEKRELYFGGTVSLLGKQKQVKIYLIDKGKPLIGTKLMADCRLTIDFPTETVELIRSPKAR